MPGAFEAFFFWWATWNRVSYSKLDIHFNRLVIHAV